MGNMFMVPDNLMALNGSAVVATSSASASMDDSNMLIESPSRFWRSTSNAPRHSWFYASNNILGEMIVSCGALVGHNMSAGDQYRFLFRDTANPPTTPAGYVEHPPTGTVGALTSNTSAGFADVDNAEASSPGTFVTRTGGAGGSGGWSLGLSFATPANPPTTGPDLQAFWVYVKGTGDDGQVTVTCDLYESGTVRQLSASRAVGTTTGQWLCFPWNASNLASSDGSGVECALNVTGTGSHYGSVWAVFWAVDWNAFDSARDSGWITYDPNIGSTPQFAPPEQRKRNTVAWRSSGAVSAAIVYVYMRVIGAATDVDYAAGEALFVQPDGYVEVGTLIIGEYWSPTYNIAYGKLVGAIDSSPRSRTYGGQLFGSRRPVRRVLSMRLGHLTPAEAHTLFDRILWRHGVMKPILISLLPDDVTQTHHTTILGTLRNPENWINIQPEQGYENALDLDWEEML